MLQMLGGLAAGGVLLDACGSGSSPSSGSGSDTLTAAQLATQLDMRTIPDPSNPVYHVIHPAVYDTVLDLDQNLKTVGKLAKSYTISSDQRRVEINLRQGVEFHTGRELTASDVKWSLTTWLQHPVYGNAKYVPAVKAATISTSGKYTIVFDSKLPNPALVRVLQLVPIGDHVTFSGQNAAKIAVGTGPFKMSQYVPNQQILFTKNPHYWKTGAPKVDQLNLKLMGDVQTIGVALRTGEVSLTGDLTGKDITSLGTSKFNVVPQPASVGFRYFATNVREGGLSNKTLRQAMNYAIDRDSIAKVTASGVAATVPWVPGSPIYKKEWDTAYQRDPDRAKSLLKSSGWDKSQTLSMPMNTNPINDQAAEVIRNNLSEIGIKVKVQQLETNSYLAKYQSPTGHDLLCSGMTSDFDPQVAFAQSVLLGVGNPQTNFTDAAYSKLLKQLLVEPDPNTAIEMGQQLTDMLLDRSVFDIVLGERAKVVASKQLQGVSVHAFSGTIMVDAVSIGN